MAGDADYRRSDLKALEVSPIQGRKSLQSANSTATYRLLLARNCTAESTLNSLEISLPSSSKLGKRSSSLSVASLPTWNEQFWRMLSRMRMREVELTLFLQRHSDDYLIARLTSGGG